MEATSRLPADRALVTLSYAQSLDGALSARGGSPTAISCDAALEACHVIRSRHDGIMVGSGTILSDNPMLTVRRVRGRNPRPVILDSGLRTPPGSAVLAAGERPLIFCGEEAGSEAEGRLEDAGAEVRRLPLEGGATAGGVGGVSRGVMGSREGPGERGGREGREAREEGRADEGWQGGRKGPGERGGREGRAEEGGRLPLGRVLRVLRECGLGSVMVEGGGRLIGDFLRSGLWDRAAINAAPFWLGGCGIDYAAGVKIRMDDVRWVTCDADVFCLGLRAK